MILCHLILKFSSASGHPSDPLQVSLPFALATLPQISSHASDFYYFIEYLLNSFVTNFHIVPLNILGLQLYNAVNETALNIY